MLRRQIDHQQRVDTGCSRITHKGFATVAVNRVVVAHQYQWRALILRAEGAHQLQRTLLVLPALQGAQGGSLNSRAVGGRVTERHAQFDDVGACGRQPFQHFQTGVEVRVTGADVGHQRGAVVAGAVGKALFETAHFASSIKPRIVGMSLSPRPDRQTTIR